MGVDKSKIINEIMKTQKISYTEAEQRVSKMTPEELNKVSGGITSGVRREQQKPTTR